MVEVYDVGWFGLSRKNHRKVDSEKVKPYRNRTSCSAAVGFPVVVEGENRVSYVDVHDPDLHNIFSTKGSCQ